MTDGQTVTLSLFRFKGLKNMLWAFSQMQFAHKPIQDIPDLGFYKLFGSGSGEGFTPWPNFAVYGILTVWPSLEKAQVRLDQAKIFQAYRARSDEHCTLYLAPYQVRGTWDYGQPFLVDQQKGQRSAPEPIAILTRATIRKRALFSFWKRAPAISEDTTKQEALTLKIGLGEIPWFHQVTFSVWSNRRAMMNFAHHRGCHASAAKAAMERGWFAESLFARFAIVDAQGCWENEPLSFCLDEAC